MMSPEDVLIEAIAAASLHGDSARLRKLFTTKLHLAIEAERKTPTVNDHGIVQISEV